MNPNICNNCGGNYEYRHGRWICQSCGSYKPEELSNEEVTLLYMAYQKLRLAEFSEAEMEFDDILRKYPENPNAYWGRLMAKYGIKYEEDFDGRRIPTCYAASIESLLSTQDYQNALRYADEENKAYYKTQAEYIERVRKEWVEKASKEKPYDIFICYKDSDLANGIERTKDSIEAQELYTYLTDLGYHVFYSHVSLRGKVGEKYEPYIFNALSTAKVMLVYGSKPEYITSTWLKNEWTRYLKRIQSGEKKPESLLVVCDGFSPNELPNVLSSKQCFSASEKTFYGDLEKTIAQILYGEKKTGAMPTAPEKKKKSKAPLLITLFLLLCAVGGFLAWNFLANTENCDHIVVNIAGKEATCTEDGMTDGQYCAVCNKVLLKQQTIPSAHKPGAEATCTDSQYCTVCGEEVRGPLEHVYEPVITAPTCALQGYTTYICACGESYISDYVQMVAHIPGAEATCVTAQTCTVCKTEIKAALGHIPGGEVTCTTLQHCTVCNAEVKATGHKAGARATCLTAQTCTVCNAELNAALGHNPGAEATCTTSQNCTRCNLELKAALGHAPGEEATCTTSQNCTVCNAELKAALGHTPGAEATCTTSQNCTVCNVELKASEHTPGEWNTVREPTETKNGLNVQKCSVCGEALDEEEIPAIGHLDLSFTSNGDGTYSVSGIGICTEADIVIPAVYNGMRVTKIADSAFQGCTALRSIVIPKNVTSIGYDAFSGCTGLLSIELSADVMRIDDRAFERCSGLVSISVNPNSPYFASVDGILFNKAKTELIHYPATKTETAYTIPDGVTIIGDYAFQYCHNLRSITIADSVTRIGNYAFYDCNKVTEVIIPDSVVSIGNTAFRFCSNLKSVIIGKGVTSIAEWAFFQCTALTSITVDQNNLSYCSENGVLFNKSKTELVCYPAGKTEMAYTISDGVTSIGDYAFAHCYDLIKITIPDSVTIIGSSAFYSCPKLTSVSIGNGVTSIGNSAFYGCVGISSIELSAGVTSIGDSAFSGCTGLLSIELPAGVMSIGSSVFDGCTGLTSIDIPGGVTSIGDYAFRNCSSLTSIVIPGGVTSIGDSAFSDCSGLTSVTIENGVISIGDSAFSYCSNLTGIVIPESVTSIGKKAFYYCSKLKSITVPFVGDTLNGTKNMHFGYIFGASDSGSNDDFVPTSLRTVIITGGSVIGESAFQNCSSLTSVTIGNGVKSIEIWAFSGCDSLTGIEIPASVTNIAERAFVKCSDLTSITVDSNNPHYASLDGVLFNKAITELLCYPAGKAGAYTIPDGVTIIGDCAFYSCANLTNVTIPDSVTTICYAGFSDCGGLTGVTIGNGVIGMGDYSFYCCMKLTSITFTGTTAEWNEISKGSEWRTEVPATKVICSDGEVSI